MAAFAPFEPNPEIAVAVSGGPDSLALTLLLDRWAAARGGRVHALTLDHGLRAEAAAEAAWVAEQLAARGIAHRVLTWRPDPARAVDHADARAARYAALADWCARHGVLHLATAHHRDDQAETALLRAGMASGPDGMAGMAAVRELRDLRVIRPLLDVPKARLEATLAAQGQAWIADPSNADPRHRRARLRRLMPDLARDGLTADHLAAYAGMMGRAREPLDDARAALAARAVTVRPAGYADVDPQAILTARAPIGRDVLGRVLRTVGGHDHPPRTEPLDRLLAALCAAPMRGRTLGGCRIVPWRGRWLVVREPGRTPAMAVTGAGPVVYDRRFRLTLERPPAGQLRAAPLGERGWAVVAGDAPELRHRAPPPPVRPALPALFDTDGPVAVPHLAWRRDTGAPAVDSFRFVPQRAVGEAAFTVAPA